MIKCFVQLLLHKRFLAFFLFYASWARSVREDFNPKNCTKKMDTGIGTIHKLLENMEKTLTSAGKSC